MLTNILLDYLLVYPSLYLNNILQLYIGHLCLGYLHVLRNEIHAQGNMQPLPKKLDYFSFIHLYQIL